VSDVIVTELCLSIAEITFMSTPAAKPVVSGVPTLRIPQPEERTQVAPVLVEALCRCSWCIMLSSDATALDASSWHRMQPG
jgi:hypothetical protein